MKWDIGHVLVLVLIILSYAYQYYENPFDIFIRIVILTITVGTITAIIWKFTAVFTVEAFKSVFDFLHGKNDLMCRIKSPQSEPGSLFDHLYMAIQWSFFPTLVVFFVLSFIAQGIASEGEAVVENNIIFGFMFFIPPAITFIAIPVRLISDSSLMRYDIQKRLLEPFGDTFKRIFRAIGGVGALASFAKVALSKGGVENTAMDTFTILLYVFPTMFIASVIYGIWHTGYLSQVEVKIETFHYTQYHYLRNNVGIIQLIRQEPIIHADDPDGTSTDTQKFDADQDSDQFEDGALEEDKVMEDGRIGYRVGGDEREEERGDEGRDEGRDEEGGEEGEEEEGNEGGDEEGERGDEGRDGGEEEVGVENDREEEIKNVGQIPLQSHEQIHTQNDREAEYRDQGVNDPTHQYQEYEPLAQPVGSIVHPAPSTLQERIQAYRRNLRVDKEDQGSENGADDEANERYEDHDDQGYVD